MNNIKRLRKKNFKTQQQMADLLGITQQGYACYENGTRIPPADMIIKLARYFNVSTDFILGCENTAITPLSYVNSAIYIFPIIGTIAAGYDGNVSFDPTGDEIPVPKYLLKTHNPNDYFVLHVVGDSMLPTYHNGDKVLIRKTNSVDSGTIAAVGFDTENATLKKVEYVKGEDWMKLIPLNPDYPVKEITGADLDLCHVYGEVVYKFDNRTSAPDNDAFTAQFNSLSAEQQKTILMLMNSMLEKKQ